MLYSKLLAEFGYDNPIFADEILALFPQYTKAYVFRLLKVSLSEKKIIRIDKGIYYLPQSTPFGLSTITALDIARKKYISNRSKTFGIFCGLSLQNFFSLTTQMPNTIEIVTNNEATRKREIVISGMKFIIRKSRIEITKDNAKIYNILQLFTEIDRKDLTQQGIKSIANYIKKNNISEKDIVKLIPSFPAKTAKNLIDSEVLSYAAS